MTKANKVSLIAFLVIGILSFACGSWLIFTTYTSPRYEDVGEIVHVRTVSGGKSGPTTFFGIRLADGSIDDPIAVNYIGPEVANGNMAKVDYVQNIVTATDLVILSGPSSSWHYHDGNLYGNDIEMIVIGVVCIAWSFYKMKKAADGDEDTTSASNNVDKFDPKIF